MKPQELGFPVLDESGFHMKRGRSLHPLEALLPEGIIVLESVPGIFEGGVEPQNPVVQGI